MSSPQIERVEEDVDDDESDGTEPYQPKPKTKKSTQPNVQSHAAQGAAEQQPQENAVKPANASRLQVDSNDNEVRSTNEVSASENPNVKPIYASKTVKKLSNDERSMLTDKFEKGVEDPYFKVIRMSNGAIRITKRRNPIVADVKQAQEERSTRIANKVGRLTNEQLLMEHIIDLETRFESMRLKHKKLKKRYNELENSIYEDVDTHVDAVRAEAEPTQHVQSQPHETHEQTQQNDENSNARAQASVDEQPAYTQKRRLKRTSWRDAVQYM